MRKDMISFSYTHLDVYKRQRQSDIYQSPSEKARLGNESGADYFISFHRNASPNANEYQGVETLVFDDQGIKAEMARNVNANLEQVGFRNIGVKERPNLTVLRLSLIHISSNSRMDKSKLTANGFTPLPTWQDALSRYLKEIE